MTQFVQHDAQQVRHIAAPVIVAGKLMIKAVVEIAAAEAARRAVDRAVELRRDVRLGRQILSRQGVGERGGIEEPWQGCARKIVEDPQRSSRTEHTATCAAAERVKAGLDDDIHGAVEESPPETGGLREDIEARLTQRRGIVAADRREGGRIIETLTR